MTDVVTKKTTVTTGTDSNSASSLSVHEEKAEKSETVGYIIYFLFGVIEIVLLFRLLFKLTGANPSSSFVSSIYSLTQIFITPFFGIFHQATAQGVETTAVLEPATIVAMIVYAVLAWGITQVVMILSRRLQ